MNSKQLKRNHFISMSIHKIIRSAKTERLKKISGRKRMFSSWCHVNFFS